MIDLQLLTKVLETKDFNIITDNGLDVKFFPHYAEEFSFIVSHYHKYRTIPDKETFLSKFPDLELPAVGETVEYLIDGIREEKQFNELGPILNKAAEFAKEGDSKRSVEFLAGAIPDLMQNFDIKGTCLIQKSHLREQELKDKKNPETPSFITTGFPEMDEEILGLKRSEEFLTIAARTNEGKSWIMLRMLMAAWERGERVGLYSGEMSVNSLGYRFDSLYEHISNYSLYKGVAKESEYSAYLERLKKNKNPFIVISPSDLGGRATVSKIAAFIKRNKLTICGVDQYSLMEDERRSKYQDRRLDFTHLCEDLRLLSKMEGVPIIGASQVNRASLQEDELPDLHHISESDGVVQNSTKVLMLRQRGDNLDVCVRKNTDGKKNKVFSYVWDIDKGHLTYVPTTETKVGEEKVKRERRKFKEDEPVKGGPF